MRNIKILDSQIGRKSSSSTSIWGITIFERFLIKKIQEGGLFFTIFTSSPKKIYRITNKEKYSNIEFTILTQAPPKDALKANIIYSLSNNDSLCIEHINEIQEAKSFLFKSIEKNRAPLSKFFLLILNRPLGKIFLKLLINFPLSPNIITLFSLLLGFYSAYLFSRGNYTMSLLGALALQLSISLDCVDGRLARLTYNSSKFGQWFDGASDQIKIHTVYLGILLGFIHLNDMSGILWTTFLIIGSISNFFLEFENAHTEQSSQVKEQTRHPKNINPKIFISNFISCFENRAGVLSICVLSPILFKASILFFAFLFNLSWIYNIYKKWSQQSSETF